MAVEDAILLSRTCKKVYLVHRRDELRADKVLQDKLFKCANVEMVWDSVPTVIEGTDKVEDIKVHNVKTDEEKRSQLMEFLSLLEFFRIQRNSKGWLIWMRAVISSQERTV